MGSSITPVTVAVDFPGGRLDIIDNAYPFSQSEMVFCGVEVELMSRGAWLLHDEGSGRL